MQRLRLHLIAWASGLPDDIVRGARWPVGWLVSASALSALLAGMAYAPPVRDFFGLRFGPVFGLQMLSLGVAWLAAEADARVGFDPLGRGLALLAVGFFFQLFGSSVVVFSEPPGCFVLAGVPLVVWWFHGILLRPTLRAPLPVAVHAAGMLCALALRPEPAQAWVLALVLPLGAGGALILGTLTERNVQRRQELAEHRAAIEAQALGAQSSERDRMAATLAALGERWGEARGLLAAALAGVDSVLALTAAAADRLEREDGTALASRVRMGLERLEHAMGDAPARAAAAGVEGVPLEPVDAARVAREVVAEAVRRFPAVALVGPEPSPPGRAPALLRGGAETLRLILESLVENACEGDGLAAARRVEISIAERPGDASVDLVLADDGPGFRADLLAATVRPFVTTKAHGTGLGLYTAAGLAAASGGEFLRENPAGGGARVTIRLRLQADAP